jgi:hypothetical protein
VFRLRILSGLRPDRIAPLMADLLTPIIPVISLRLKLTSNTQTLAVLDCLSCDQFPILLLQLSEQHFLRRRTFTEPTISLPHPRHRVDAIPALRAERLPDGTHFLQQCQLANALLPHPQTHIAFMFPPRRIAEGGAEQRARSLLDTALC